MPATSSLVVVIGAPLKKEHIEATVEQLITALHQWDLIFSGVDLNTELLNFVNKNVPPEPVGVESYSLRLESGLNVELLINPNLRTLVPCLRHFVDDTTFYKHLIYAGPVVAGSGHWLLCDNLFGVNDLVSVFGQNLESEAKNLGNRTKFVVSCLPEGAWANDCKQLTGLSSENVEINVNPSNNTTLSCASDFGAYVSQLLSQTIDTDLVQMMPGTDLVGNIKFNRPTFYVFPAGDGDAGLFGFGGFTLLLDGGTGRKPSYWPFIRHLDRIDALLVSQVTGENLTTLGSMITRKNMEQCYPQIGHVFANLPPPTAHNSNPLIVSPFDQVVSLQNGLAGLGLKPHPAHWCISAATKKPEPIALYYKVGHGRLDMYVLNPPKDSKEVTQFIDQWKKQQMGGINKLLPSTSLAVLIVWQPVDPEAPVTRILYPGGCSLHRVFEALEKLRSAVPFLNKPVYVKGAVEEKVASNKSTSKKPPVTSNSKPAPAAAPKAPPAKSKPAASSKPSPALPLKRNSQASAKPSEKRKTLKEEIPEKKKTPSPVEETPKPIRKPLNADGKVSPPAPKHLKSPVSSPTTEEACSMSNNHVDMDDLSTSSELKAAQPDSLAESGFSAALDSTQKDTFSPGFEVPEDVSPLSSDELDSTQQDLDIPKHEIPYGANPMSPGELLSTQQDIYGSDEPDSSVPQGPFILERQLQNAADMASQEAAFNAQLDKAEAEMESPLLDDDVEMPKPQQLSPVTPFMVPVPTGEDTAKQPQFSPDIEMEPVFNEDLMQRPQQLIPFSNMEPIFNEKHMEDSSPIPEDMSPNQRIETRSPVPEDAALDDDFLSSLVADSHPNFEPNPHVAQAPEMFNHNLMGGQTLPGIPEQPIMGSQSPLSPPFMMQPRTQQQLLTGSETLQHPEVLMSPPSVPKPVAASQSPQPSPEQEFYGQQTMENPTSASPRFHRDSLTPPPGPEGRISPEVAKELERKISMSMEPHALFAGLISLSSASDDAQSPSPGEHNHPSEPLPMSKQDSATPLFPTEQRVTAVGAYDNKAFSPSPGPADKTPPQPQFGQHVFSMDQYRSELSSTTLESPPDSDKVLSPPEPEPVQNGGSLYVSGFTGSDKVISPLTHNFNDMSLESPPQPKSPQQSSTVYFTPGEEGDTSERHNEKTPDSQATPVPSLQQMQKEWGEPLGLPAPPTRAPASADKKKPAATGTKATNSKHGPTTGTSTAPSSTRRSAPAGKPSNPGPAKSSAPASHPTKPVAAKTGPPPAKSAGMGRSSAATPKKPICPLTAPVYVDLAYIPGQGNAPEDFFKLIRSRHYVLSSAKASKETLDGFLAGKKSWKMPELEANLIPTYDSQIIDLWIAVNEPEFATEKIDVKPSAERCELNLEQSDGTTCATYRIEL